MEGTIEIKADGTNLAISVKTSRLSMLDKLTLIDGLARSLQVDPLEKQMIGLTLAAGGVEATGMANIDETMIDLSALKKQKTGQGLTSEKK